MNVEYFTNYALMVNVHLIRYGKQPHPLQKMFNECQKPKSN